MTEDIELLRKISTTLDDIKSILVLTNEKRINEAKKSLLKEGSVKIQVYDLCDGSRSTQEIAQSLSKAVDYVNSYLSILRREGLIRTTEKNGKLIHEQTF